jgi:hypothetical protein
MGAATFTKDARNPDGILNDKRTVKGVLALSATYANPAGDTLALGTTGLTELHDIYVTSAGGPSGHDAGYSVRLVGTKTVPLIQAYETEATQVANATSLAGRPLDVLLVGL